MNAEDEVAACAPKDFRLLKFLRPIFDFFFFFNEVGIGLRQPWYYLQVLLVE